MSYIISLLIIVGVIWLYKSKVKNNWRRMATILAAVYQNYNENYEPRETFIKTLEFRYRPPKLLDVLNEEEKNRIPSTEIYEKALTRINKNLPRLIDRYLSILFLLGFDDVLQKYFKEEQRIFNHPGEKIGTILENNKFTFNKGDYSVTELVYCMLVIEYPKVVAHVPKDKANYLIDNFLELSQNAIHSTAQDPQLRIDMKSIENL